MVLLSGAHGSLATPFRNSKLIHTLSKNYDSITILFQALSFIIEKCLQNSATFGAGFNFYSSGNRVDYLKGATTLTIDICYSFLILQTYFSMTSVALHTTN